jgi:hypothetical protein
LEVAEPVATFSNDIIGLTANVRQSGDDFEITIIDALSGDEVLSTRRPTREVAEQFASELMNPSPRPIAARRRSGMDWV